jgi:hypothetical protein
MACASALTLGLLIVASLTSLFREGRIRARWLGFALFGWMHLKYGWPDAAGPAFDVPFRPRFPRTRVVQDVFMRLGILFAGSAQQGMERWSVIQAACQHLWNNGVRRVVVQRGDSSGDAGHVVPVLRLRRNAHTNVPDHGVLVVDANMIKRSD